MSRKHPENVSGGKDYDEMMIQYRVHFRVRTRRFLQNIPRLVQYWKKQSKADFCNDLRRSGNIENSVLTTKEYAKLCEAMIKNCDFMISCMKGYNDYFENEIEDLVSNPVGSMSDLRIERYKASLGIRKKIITDLEKETLELVDKMNERDESEYFDHCILHMRACATLNGGGA